MIRDPLNQNIQYFPDANFVIREINAPVWEALQEANDRTILAAPVYYELKEWLDDPRRNLELHRAITDAFASDDPQWIGTLGIGHREPVLKAVLDYYVSLLSLRRSASDLARFALRQKTGNEPTRSEVMNFCKDEFGLRTQFLAKKGRDEAEEKKHINVNDEVLVVMGILFAIVSGEQTMILTHDRDVFDLFYKAIWLIDTHYKAMHFAQCYRNDPLPFRAKRIVSEGHGFRGEVILLEKPSSMLMEVLPPNCSVVPIHCVYMEDELVQLTFCLETEMRDLVEIKAKTDGLCTELFEGRNIHIDLGPVISHFGNYAAIGFDSTKPGDVGNCRVSYLDSMHAIYSNETFFDLQPVASEFLLLPPHCRVSE